MDWSRAKTILIVFLFAVNIFLFGTYMTKENEAKEDALALQEEVVSVLLEQGIQVSRESIPSEQVKIRHATLNISENTEDIAKKLLGEAEKTIETERTAYSSPAGNLMFSSDSFSVVYEAGKAVKTSEEAKNLAREIAGKMNISHMGSEIQVTPAQGGYNAIIPQVFGGVRIFGADIELNISETGSVLGNGRFIGAGRLTRAEGKTMTVASLLLEFADEIKREKEEKINISDIRCGYTAKNPAGGSVYLVPTLEISSDAGKFYVNMSDGALIEI